MAAKLPFILLPGLLCDAALWQAQINSLKSMVDCHVPDLTKHDNIAGLARAILTAAPPQFALAGLSMGGYVALEIMRQSPDRVLKLCLVDTSARADTPEQKQRRRVFLAMASAGKFKGVTPRLLPMLIHTDRLEDKNVTQTVYDMAERIGRDGFYNQQTAIMNRIDSRPYLKTIRCPVQVICGQQDALMPPDIAREISDGIPNAQLDLIEHCGHLSPLEQPDKVSALMERWLRRQ